MGGDSLLFQSPGGGVNHVDLAMTGLDIRNILPNILLNDAKVSSDKLCNDIIRTALTSTNYKKCLS